jgi:hypothetical protein
MAHRPVEVVLHADREIPLVTILRIERSQWPECVASLAKQLAERDFGRGLISTCAAGGQGVTAILER